MGRQLGFELARLFAQDGFDLIVAAQDEDIVTATRELEQNGSRVEVVQVDLATDAGINELHDRIKAAGRPVPVRAALNSQTEPPRV